MQLPATQWGDALEPRALLVHGLSSDSTSWWRVGPWLAGRGWRAVGVDLRGHGGADRAESYALADYAADLPREDWDLVVAHSLGAAAAVIAATTPGFARRLVLLDPVLEVRAEDQESIVADQVSELGLDAASLAEAKPHWHERDRDAKLHGVGAVDPEAVTRSFTDSAPWDVAAAATALEAPTLVLTGDPHVYSMLDPATAERIAARNPLVEVRAIDGAGHSPHRDRPDETLGAIGEWLDAH